MSEHNLQSAIIEYLRYAGALVIRINSGSVLSTEQGKRRYIPFYRWFVLGHQPQIAGVSDILAVHRGRFYAIEVKTPARKRESTEAQRAFTETVIAHGGIGLVVSDVDELRPYFEQGLDKIE